MMCTNEMNTSLRRASTVIVAAIAACVLCACEKSEAPPVADMAGYGPVTVESHTPPSRSTASEAAASEMFSDMSGEDWKFPLPKPAVKREDETGVGK